MPDRNFDEAYLYGAIARAVREDGYTTVTATDVEETHRAMLDGREPQGLIGRAIARQLRLIEKGGG